MILPGYDIEIMSRKSQLGHIVLDFDKHSNLQFGSKSSRNGNKPIQTIITTTKYKTNILTNVMNMILN